LYFRRGSASDLIVLDRVEQEFSPTKRELLVQMLGKEGRGSAAQRLAQLPFALHKGTNHFNDDFHVLYFCAKLDEFYDFKKLKNDISAELDFQIIAELLSNISGVDVRHVAIGLDQDITSEPETAAPSHHDPPAAKSSVAPSETIEDMPAMPGEELTVPRACA